MSFDQIKFSEKENSQPVNKGVLNLLLKKVYDYYTTIINAINASISSIQSDINQVESDISDLQNVGYKEYIALLTQNGASNVLTTTSGTLTAGVTYEITDFQDGDDFTNVGAPLNATGVKFVATGENPTVWNYSSELTWDEATPVVTVLKNDIDDIYFQYLNPGSYTLNSNSVFTDSKTIITTGSGTDEGDQSLPCFVGAISASDAYFYLVSKNGANLPADSCLYKTLINIRVYN